MFLNPSLRFVPDDYEDLLILVRGERRCFDDLVATLSSVLAYMFMADTARNGVLPQIAPQFPFTMNSNTTAREYTLFPMHLIWAISQDEWIDRLELYVDVAIDREVRGELRNEGHQRIVGRTIASSFVRYYEAHKPEVVELAGDHPSDWPEPWNFARILRNAFAHGGIHFLSPDSSAVRWRTIEFGPEDNGVDPLFPHVGFGDLVDLYLELDQALDR